MAQYKDSVELNDTDLEVISAGAGRKAPRQTVMLGVAPTAKRTTTSKSSSMSSMRSIPPQAPRMMAAPRSGGCAGGNCG